MGVVRYFDVANSIRSKADQMAACCENKKVVINSIAWERVEMGLLNIMLAAVMNIVPCKHYL